MVGGGKEKYIIIYRDSGWTTVGKETRMILYIGMDTERGSDVCNIKSGIRGKG